MSFQEKYGPWAIIAGASEGTGRSFSRAIAARGVHCIMIANGGPLEQEAAAIRSEFGVEVVTALIDLSRPDSFGQILAAAGSREIGLYVSNAGTDPFGSRFHDKPVTGWLDIIGVNIGTMVQSAHHFGGQMRQRGHGGLLMVNSGACYGGGDRLAIYTACKAFQLNFCESIWTELRKWGVDVLTLVLGKTDTPSYHRLQERKGMPSDSKLASPDAVAEEGLSRLPFGPVHNFGMADDQMGYAPFSAAQLRARVLAMDKAIAEGFGKE